MGKVSKVAIITIAGILSVAVTAAAALLVALAVMTLFVTVQTIFNLDLPLQGIAAMTATICIVLATAFSVISFKTRWHGLFKGRAQSVPQSPVSDQEPGRK